jgi:hypothetical protein
MHKKISGLLLISLFTTAAFADEATYKIKQLISNKNLVVSESSSPEPVELGKIFLATFTDNTQCSLKVIGQNKNMITMDSAECDRAKNLVLNQKLEPSLHTVVEDTKPVSPVATPVVKSKPVSAPIEPAPVYARSISDLSYLAPRHTFALSAGFSSDNTEYSVYSGTTLGSDVKIRTTRISSELKFGLTDDLNLDLALAMVPGRNVEYSSTGNTYYSKGLEDPSLSLDYRLIAQSAQTPMDVVITVAFSPKTIEAKTATDKSDGTMGSGRNSLAAALAASKKFSAVDLGMRIIYASLWSGKNQDAETGDETELGTYDALSFQLAAQFKLTDAFLLQTGATIRSYSAYETKDTAANTTTKQSAYTDTSFYIGPRFVVIPQKSVLDFGVETTATTNIDVTSGTTKLKAKDYTSTKLSASVKYEF